MKNSKIAYLRLQLEIGYSATCKWVLNVIDFVLSSNKKIEA